MRHPLQTVAVAAAAIALAAGAALGLGACAGELPDKNRPATPATVVGSSTSFVESQADQLGGQVADLWAEVMQRLVPLIDGSPPFASIEPDITQLKEEYVQMMVDLGRQIDALDEIDLDIAYTRTADDLSGMGSTDWFVKYMDIYNAYTLDESQAAQDFAILLSSFDTLTDYAYFDVLLTNAPEEAARLGLE